MDFFIILFKIISLCDYLISVTCTTESSLLDTNCGKWVPCWIESIIFIGMCICSVYVYVHYIHVCKGDV